jgi:hypothetical protein
VAQRPGRATPTAADAVNKTTGTDGSAKIMAFAGRLGNLTQVRWASLSVTDAAWHAAGLVPSRAANTRQGSARLRVLYVLAT